MNRLMGATICSGVGAPEVAAPWIDWALASEIEAFPRAVLMDRLGAVPIGTPGATTRRGAVLWADFTALRIRHFRRFGIPLPEVIVAGTPCQAFSVAGNRNSMADPRGNLTIQFVRLIDAIDNARRTDGERGPCVVWENVPGVLSTKDNAFGCFLAALVGTDAPLVPHRGQRWTNAGLVVGPRRAAAWCVKDAQYFGLAQRRKRVLLVACPRDGFDPSAILFEPEGVRRHHPPSQVEAEDLAGTLAGGARRRGGYSCDDNIPLTAGTLTGSTGGADENDACDGRLVVGALSAAMGRMGWSADYVPSCYSGVNTSGAIEVSPTLLSHGGRIDFDSEMFVTHTLRGEGNYGQEACCHTEAGVRRIMPVEAERLQGFRDGYTLIPYRGKPASDGPRYKGIGNSMPVPVMAWVLRRLSNAIINSREAP